MGRGLKAEGSTSRSPHHGYTQQQGVFTHTDGPCCHDAAVGPDQAPRKFSTRSEHLNMTEWRDGLPYVQLWTLETQEVSGKTSIVSSGSPEDSSPVSGGHLGTNRSALSISEAIALRVQLIRPIYSDHSPL